MAINIGLCDVDNGKYPNLALMKISAWHKSKGDSVSWFAPSLDTGVYDKIYAAKVFTFTKAVELPEGAILGGTGYDIGSKLPGCIDIMCPDYSLYDCGVSYGFTTRGCIRKCSWCFVPEKEGALKPYADVEAFLRHDSVVIMDNNILASAHGLNQIEKLIKLKIKVDFNQGLDARLIDLPMARLLAKVKWLKPLRLALDKSAQIPNIWKAVRNLRTANCTPSRYFCYVLIKEIPDALERVLFLKTINVDPFAQPYRDFKGNVPSKDVRRFARWVNHKAIFKSTEWQDYQLTP